MSFSSMAVLTEAGTQATWQTLPNRALRERSVSYRRYNLSEHPIDYCWCCYAVKADSCAFPCRNKNDDMPAFHAMLAASKAVIVASPINWNGMSARLKTFLDRTTCMENLYHIGKPGLTEGKVAGILVNGHEDGAIKTAMDIWLNFQQTGVRACAIRHSFQDAWFGIQQQHGPGIFPER